MKLSSGEKDGLSWTESSMPTQASPQPVRRNQPQQSEAEAADRIECPRCKSRNTKFCYYNNYNKSQPRHFCKCCKRHWTKGGTLRTVPVGGGRRYKKFKSSSLATIPANSLFQASSTSQQNGIPINGFSVDRSFPESFTRLSPDENKKFSFSSSVGVFDNTVSSLTNSTPDEHKVISYGGMKNEDTSVESTISTISTSAFSQPWVGPTNSATMEVPSYWNWNDIDNLISGDLDATWGDYEDIKF